MVLNSIEAMHSRHNAIEIIDREGELVAACEGRKEEVAQRLFQLIELRLMRTI